jgi:hypothetical protein
VRRMARLRTCRSEYSRARWSKSTEQLGNCSADFGSNCPVGVRETGQSAEHSISSARRRQAARSCNPR